MDEELYARTVIAEHSVGEATEQEREWAYQAWSAYLLGLCSLSVLINIRPHVLSEAKQRFTSSPGHEIIQQQARKKAA